MYLCVLCRYHLERGPFCGLGHFCHFGMVYIGIYFGSVLLFLIYRVRYVYSELSVFVSFAMPKDM